ncbi:hypothetical protein EDB84DRAFT_1443994, partial [Lactarius hengduanensis]
MIVNLRRLVKESKKTYVILLREREIRNREVEVLQRDGDKGSATRAVWRWTKAIQGTETGIGRFRGERPSWSVEKSPPSTSTLNIPLWPLGPWAPELRVPSRPLKAQGSRSLRWIAPSAYLATRRPRHLRWLIRWAVGDLFPRSGSGGGGEVTVDTTWFSFLLSLTPLPPPPNVPLWPLGPWAPEPRVPSRPLKAQGSWSLR